MEPAFWQSRWSEGRTPFHEGRPNAHLVRHGALLGTKRRVLVPLCGKAEDLATLASMGHEVVGIEMVGQAVDAFFAEHGLNPTERTVGGCRMLSAGRITVIHANLFDVDEMVVGPVDALYDRAALIALPPDVRARYVATVRRWLKPRSQGLLVSVEYPSDAIEAPPFSVKEDEVRALYRGAAVTLLDTTPADGPRLANVAAQEKCFSLKT